MTNLLDKTNILLKQIAEITSFDAVAKWDNEAREVLGLLKKAFEEANGIEEILKKDLTSLEIKYKNLPFYKKIFYNKKMENAILAKIQEIRNTKDTHTRCIDFLEEWIEKTPDDKNQADLMLKELKLMKKELTTAKKEISAQIKDINNKARMENAQVSTEYFSSAKSKQLQKIQIRMNKENSLLSQQDQKAAMDKQIIDIEKLINWVERIKM